MLKWETETNPEPARRSVMAFNNGNGAVVVTSDRDGCCYQHIRLHIIEDSDESHDSCCVTCPEMLIAKARAALDELEADLKGQTCEEP